MLLELNEKWRLNTIDNLNIALEQKKVNNQKKSENFGKEYWEVAGYYGGLEEALVGYVKKSSISYTSTTLKDVLQEIKKTHTTINKLTRKSKDDFMKMWQNRNAEE